VNRDVGRHAQRRLAIAKSEFDLLVKSLRDQQLHFVDSRTWEDDWGDSWVSFSDVLGFASRCRHSEPAVVNSIVRFHRSVAAAKAELGLATVRLFQFTDAAFAVSEDLEAMLRFSTMLQHQCLAQNAIILHAKAHALAHHLLVVRTTVARGRTLTLPEPVPPELRTLGVRAESLLAGKSVVDAYEIEKETVGCMIAFPSAQRAQIVSDAPEIRGSEGHPKAILRRWLGVGDSFNHDGVVDFPWVLTRPIQDRGGLWADSKTEIVKKLRVLAQVAELQSGEFLMAKSRLPVAKHHAGLVRHIKETLQRLNGRTHLRRWSDADLLTTLADRAA
jgi:hypothetical protein